MYICLIFCNIYVNCIKAAPLKARLIPQSGNLDSKWLLIYYCIIIYKTLYSIKLNGGINMPAASTHYIFAKETMPLIKDLVDFKIDPRAFYYGTQGPDLYFFHRLLPWQLGKSYRTQGIDLHNNACPTDILNAIKKYFRENPDDIIGKSYLLGFMCHYCLDSTTHAYIYFVNFEMKDKMHPRWWSFTVHNKVEFNIDTILIQEKLGIEDAESFKIYETFSLDPEVVSAVGRCLAYLSNEVFDRSLDAQKVSLSCKDTRNICKFTTNTPKWKRKAVKILEAPIYPFLGPAVSMFMRPAKPRTDWDYLNLSHGEWTNPNDENDTAHTDSFPELYEQAKVKFKNMVCGFYKSLQDDSDMTYLTSNIGFSHCVPINETVK